jgi:predicted nucleic acid-binding protein
MAVYFADSSFWIALVDRRDAHHAQALEWSLNTGGRIVTTEAVLLETINTFSRPHWRDKVIALVEHIESRDDIEIVRFSEALWDGGWELFRRRPDKSWSLTDCLSFELMKARAISDALTADSHFQQAGFRAIFLDDP